MKQQPNSSHPQRVLVLGANGRFGATAVSAFAEAGWEVVAQVRRTPQAPRPGVRYEIIDPTHIDALEQAARGARAVVHAINPPFTAWRTQMLPLARSGMDLALRLNATFMLPGNIYNYGRNMPAVLREDTPQRPDTVKGRLRVDLETEIHARQSIGLRSVVIRAGDFFGGGTGNWFDEIITSSLRKGRLVYPGPLDVKHDWTYLPDLARAFVAAAERDHLPLTTTLLFSGYALTGTELLDGIERNARALGVVAQDRPLKRSRLPWSFIRAGGLLVPTWRELSEMAYLWQVPHALDGSALRRTLGTLPTTPLDEALRQSLRALQFDAPAERLAA